MAETIKTLRSQVNFQDLMLVRIHEILLVASAFILEEEGGLTQQILYEYLGMNLSYAPRVWHAKSATKALDMLSHRKYDMVIVMMRIADMDPVTFGSKVKKLFPKKPVILLAFDPSEIKQIPEKRLTKSIDKIFIWSGNANVFPAIIKYYEDKKNVKRDYKIADIRCIIVVEDNPRYYSILLPLLYKIALKHARNLINSSLSDADRILMFRARPKILLTSTYEEAIDYYKKYRNNILGIVSDVRFPMSGKLDPDAGVKLTRFIKELDPDMPIILQSTNQDQEKEAQKADAQFLHKHSGNLLQEIEKFIVNNFGFGDFVFRTSKQKEISRATDLISLKKAIKLVPGKSLEFHASRNHFSNWIAVRGEFKIASKLRSMKIHHFDKTEDLRNILIEFIDKAILEQHKGRIAAYSKSSREKKMNFTRISTGSLGGKARGLAFANSMLMESGIPEKYPNILIRIPNISVIGTDEFDQFMGDNNLWQKVVTDKSNSSINRLFLKASLPTELEKLLKNFLNDVKYPLAVRSSSLFEDSQYQPLAGMYATYMIPNANKHKKDRLHQLCNAIKLVYASMFYQEPKALIESSVHNLSEEKMAVVLMELIGKKYDDIFYPTISGSAQSFNYYPVSYMEREEGVAFVALGLGRTVVEGEKALRFSPKYPAILPQYYSIKATIDSSQNSFYALNLTPNKKLLSKGEKGNLKSYKLSRAEKDGELKWAASVVCGQDNVIRESLRYQGTRVITFPSVLKWNTIPLTDIILDLLEIGENSLGCPVEIEFASNVYDEDDKPSEFCLLQIKPLVTRSLDRFEELESSSPENIICKSEAALGNGIIQGIQDIILVDPQGFDPAHTKIMAKEIEFLNIKLEGKPCILMGPGRWGSADHWLGIPVKWQQISNAKVIVELGIEDFPVDPSFGSHFFQNVTSMRIGYFTVNHKKKSDDCNLKWIKSQHTQKKKKYTRLIHLENPLLVKIDGRTGTGIIQKPVEQKMELMDEQESSGI